MFKPGDDVYVCSQKARGKVLSSFDYGRDGRMGTGYFVEVVGKGGNYFHANDLESMTVLPLRERALRGGLRLVVDNPPNDQPEPPRAA